MPRYVANEIAVKQRTEVVCILLGVPCPVFRFTSLPAPVKRRSFPHVRAVRPAAVHGAATGATEVGDALRRHDGAEAFAHDVRAEVAAVGELHLEIGRRRELRQAFVALERFDELRTADNHRVRGELRRVNDGQTHRQRVEVVVKRPTVRVPMTCDVVKRSPETKTVSAMKPHELSTERPAATRALCTSSPSPKSSHVVVVLAAVTTSAHAFASVCRAYDSASSSASICKSCGEAQSRSCSVPLSVAAIVFLVTVSPVVVS